MLDNYSFFIDKIRGYQKEGFLLEKALLTAVKYCIEHNRLKDFLETHSSEVHNMLITAEYDPIEEREALREEAWEYGHEEGLKEGHAQGRDEKALEIAREMKVAGLSVAEIERFTGLLPATIEQL
jgi:predicted transposase/invertase (TIGR01784 family)